jgi:hypothetical protein
MKKDSWLYAAAFTSGIVVWILISSVSGKREAWDSNLYFTFGIPALGVIAGVLGFVQPDRTWRWGIVPYLGQGVWMLANQGFGNLFPLGMVVLGLFAVPSIVTAKVGAAISNRITSTSKFQ